MPQISVQDAIDLAKRAQQGGDLQRAETIYRQVLSVSPDHPEALHLLGLVEFQSGRLEVAGELIERAIRFAPAAPHFHANLGLVRVQMGRFDEAIVAYGRALKLHEDFPQAKQGLAGAQAKWAKSLHDRGRIEAAIEAYRSALKVLPDDVELHNNLGAGLLDLGRPDEAMGSFQRALALREDYGEAQVNLGTALRDLGRLDEAMQVYRAVAERFPGWYVPRASLGILMLLRGDFRGGWPLLESRWDEPELANFRKSYEQPQWRGENLSGGPTSLTAGRRIILHAEQGFGDAMQFIRYVPKVIERGGRVIVACQPELLRLFQASVKGVEQWITPGMPIPSYDVHSSLMSLPLLFDTVQETIPHEVPYLHASADLSTKWAERVKSKDARLKVGLTWAGRPAHRLDRSRSIPPAALAALAEAPHVQFISLQVGREGSSDLNFEISDFTPDLTDFAETAALIANLDLVITVDTAIAHLAGAMGKPVWVLIQFSPDWRWMLNRTDSPWYPSMRLVRQTEAGNWTSPIREVADELNRLPGGEVSRQAAQQ